MIGIMLEKNVVMFFIDATEQTAMALTEAFGWAMMEREPTSGLNVLTVHVDDDDSVADCHVLPFLPGDRAIVSPVSVQDDPQLEAVGKQ